MKSVHNILTKTIQFYENNGNAKNYFYIHLCILLELNAFKLKENGELSVSQEYQL